MMSLPGQWRVGNNSSNQNAEASLEDLDLGLRDRDVLMWPKAASEVPPCDQFLACFLSISGMQGFACISDVNSSLLCISGVPYCASPLKLSVSLLTAKSPNTRE